MRCKVCEIITKKGVDILANILYNYNRQKIGFTFYTIGQKCQFYCS